MFTLRFPALFASVTSSVILYPPASQRSPSFFFFAFFFFFFFFCQSLVIRRLPTKQFLHQRERTLLLFFFPPPLIKKCGPASDSRFTHSPRLQQPPCGPSFRINCCPPPLATLLSGRPFVPLFFSHTIGQPKVKYQGFNQSKNTPCLSPFACASSVRFSMVSASRRISSISTPSLPDLF